MTTLAQYKSEVQQRTCNERVAAIHLGLLDAGVKCVTAEYSGSGDSGQIGEVMFFNVEYDDIDKSTQCMSVTTELSDEVESLLYDILETRYGGWENEDGGCGTFVWDLMKPDGFKHEHTVYYTESSTETTIGLDGLKLRP